ncbi:MAG: hypothetical protein QXL15_02340, partial [Candidatus Korarchaeota archaeon]
IIGITPYSNASVELYIGDEKKYPPWNDIRGLYYGEYFLNYSSFDEIVNITINFNISGVLLTKIRVFYYNMSPLFMTRNVNSVGILYNTTYYAVEPFAVTVELDWNVEFFDPLGEKTAKLIISQKIFGREYLMVRCVPTYGEFFAGNYVIRVFAPNYISSIATKVNRAGETISTDTFYIGELLIFEVEGGYNGTFSISLYHRGELYWNTSIYSAENKYIFYIPLNLTQEGKIQLIVVWENETQYGYKTLELNIIPAPPEYINYLIYGVFTGLFTVGVIIYLRHWLHIRNWEEKIKILYVYTPDGRYLWSYGFKPGKTFDPVLIVNFLSAITSFMEEAVSGGKRLDVISQEENKIVISWGNKIVTALLTEKYVEIMKKKLDQFTKEFERYYSSELEKFTGNINVFNDALLLLHKTFPSKAFKATGRDAAIFQLKVKFAMLMSTKKRLENELKAGKIDEKEFMKGVKEIQHELEECLSQLNQIEKES